MFTRFSLALIRYGRMCCGHSLHSKGVCNTPLHWGTKGWGTKAYAIRPYIGERRAGERRAYAIRPYIGERRAGERRAYAIRPYIGERRAGERRAYAIRPYIGAFGGLGSFSCSEVSQTPNPPPNKNAPFLNNQRSNSQNACVAGHAGSLSNPYATISNVTASSAHDSKPTNVTKKPSVGDVASATKTKKIAKKNCIKSVGWPVSASAEGCASSRRVWSDTAPSKKNSVVVGH